MTSPNLTNVVWVKTILYSYRHIRPKKVKYPIPEIPDDSENKSGMDWVLPKIIGSGRVSGTRQALIERTFEEEACAIIWSLQIIPNSEVYQNDCSG